MAEDTRYAGFWLRMIADFVDSLLIDSVTFLLVLVTMGAVYWIQILTGSNGATPQPTFMEVISSIWLQVFLMLIRGALSLAYFGWGTFRFGTTLGKRMLGIYVVNFSETEHSPISLKQSIIRCISYLVSYLPLGAGFMMAAFHPQKRALHDLIAGTASIVKKR